MLRIADEEAKHAAIWQRYTGGRRSPSGKVLRFSLSRACSASRSPSS
ncbi:MAG: hypothetical protein ACLTMP_01340 [Eggerthella lenta]